MLTRDGEQLVSNVNGRFVLVLVHGILPPVFKQLLHDCKELQLSLLSVTSVPECMALSTGIALGASSQKLDDPSHVTIEMHYNIIPFVLIAVSLCTQRAKFLAARLTASGPPYGVKLCSP